MLKCIIQSERITVIELDKIFRQAAKSKIILNAHKVNSGEGFVQDKDGELNKDFYFVEEANPEKILNFVLSLYKDGLKKFEGYENFKSVQIITPSKKGTVRHKRTKQKNPRTNKPRTK